MRRRLALLLPLALVTGLVACTAEPTVDQTEIDAWASSWDEAFAGRADLVGGNSGMVPEDASESRMELGYSVPVRVDGFEVACFPGGFVEVAWEIRADGRTESGGAMVDCGGDTAPLSLDEPIEQVTAVVWSVSAAEGAPAAFRSAIIGEEPAAADD